MITIENNLMHNIFKPNSCIVKDNKIFHLNTAIITENRQPFFSPIPLAGETITTNETRH